MSASKILSGVSKLFTGGFFQEVTGLVKDYFPPEIAPIKKAEFEIALKKLEAKKTIEADNALRAAAVALDRRIAEQEGTASDLLKMPVLGRVMLFFRGLQRPVWGFSTLCMDYKWFFGNTTFTDKQETALMLITMLVLGFLFGERTIKNLEPLLIKMFGK